VAGTMRVVIIGGGAAAVSAIEAFRKHDRTSAILLVSSEKHPPYSRVLLPYLVLGRTDIQGLFYRSTRFYDRFNVRTLLGRSVVGTDLSQKRLYLDTGETIPFDRLLIASGSSPVKPTVRGLDSEEIGHFWTMEDALRVGRCFKGNRRLMIMGGGFISLMLAWVAVQRNLEVTITEIMDHVMPQSLDRTGAEMVETAMRREGVRVLTGTAVQRVEKRSRGQYRVYPADRRPFDVDMVVVAAGVRPNIAFLEIDSVRTDRGILVSDTMETSVPGIYAAGDVAQGPSVLGDRWATHALWTTAVEHGTIAGSNMAGREVHYRGSLSGNVSEFFHLTVASMGMVRKSPEIDEQAYLDREGGVYVKLLLHRRVPVGGVLIGRAEDVASFGILRSCILRKREIPRTEDLRVHPLRLLRPLVGRS